MKTVIHTNDAPAAIGTYSQAVRAGDAIYVSGQIGLDPASQRAVIMLRDVQGWSSDEVCNALDITEVNQRVLLHRARAKVRNALEDYLASESK